MPLKATERDVYEFFSKAGKVSAVTGAYFLFRSEFYLTLWFMCSNHHLVLVVTCKKLEFDRPTR